MKYQLQSDKRKKYHLPHQVELRQDQTIHLYTRHNEDDQNIFAF